MNLDSLLAHREKKVKKLQSELALLEKKRVWFIEREESIGVETLKLENESVEARKRGDLRRERDLEEFLYSLKEAIPAVVEKRAEITKQIATLQEHLKSALQEKKVVEKLHKNHYNRQLLKQRKNENQESR
ncbi:MAG: hypothetical protein H7A36_00580 [Chlamydiales bacterium]|nr:hypothetical protein [Chlamydiales bacterium]